VARGSFSFGLEYFSDRDHLFVGVVIFGGHVYGNYFVLISIALLGGILFQLIGFVIASLTKTVDAAQGMTQAIVLPMMFSVRRILSDRCSARLAQLRLFDICPSPHC
jgi:hypothetical protein